jgi:hypothetical protein
LRIRNSQIRLTFSHSEESTRIAVNCSPSTTHTCHWTQNGNIYPVVEVESRPNFGRARPNPERARPKLERARPNLERTRPKFGHSGPNFGRKSLNFEKTRPNVGHYSPKLPRDSMKFGRNSISRGESSTKKYRRFSKLRGCCGSGSRPFLPPGESRSKFGRRRPTLEPTALPTPPEIAPPMPSAHLPSPPPFDGKRGPPSLHCIPGCGLRGADRALSGTRSVK